MMYSQKYIASLKVGGKILRETNGTVSLPFGSEYGVLLKNLNSRRATVKVTVDGQDATDGTKLILPANGSIELERFIKNGNLKSGNRFKFIERTSKIEDHRGIKEDDGLIRVEFWAEKEVVDVPVVRRYYYDEYHPRYQYYYPYWPYHRYTDIRLGGSQTGDLNWGGSSLQASCNNSQFVQSGNIGSAGEGFLRSADSGLSGQIQAQNMSCQTMDLSNDAGITVPGSKSDQQFQSSYGFQTESNSHVIVLQLKGFVGDKPVITPVTVDRKPVCPTCGTTNKPQNKFCKECGTGLQLV